MNSILEIINLDLEYVVLTKLNNLVDLYNIDNNKKYLADFEKLFNENIDECNKEFFYSKLKEL